jgi:O-antigen/teichoic acid export membrane protein
MTVTIILNILLIPKLGYMGSSITFALSSFFMLIASLYYGQKNYPIPYDIKGTTAYLILAGILIFISQYYITINSLFTLAIKNLLLLAFVFGLLYSEVKIRGLNPLKAKF